MKPLIVLILSFIISSVTTYFIGGSSDYILSGNIAMCVMLCFTATAHFAFKKGMQMMMPGFIPYKSALVFITGIVEIILGIGLLFKEFHYTVSWIIIIFFVLLLPVNINAALKRINYQKANFDGPGIDYLWFRIPLQLVFIVWVWYFGIKSF